MDIIIQVISGVAYVAILITLCVRPETIKRNISITVSAMLMLSIVNVMVVIVAGYDDFISIGNHLFWIFVAIVVTMIIGFFGRESGVDLGVKN